MMKVKLTSMLQLLLVLTLFSCHKHNDNPNEQRKKDIQSNMQQGTWRITKYIDDGIIETSDFTGYNFTFFNSGILNANNGVNNYNGTWSVTYSDSDDDSLNDLDFNILFALGNQFDDLTDDWDIISYTASKIELIDVSGGNGGTDYLTFEKN